MLTGGKVGDGKAGLALEILKRYGQLGPDSNRRRAVNLFRGAEEHADFFWTDGGDAVDKDPNLEVGRKREYLLVLDGNECLQVEPRMPQGTVRTVTQLARAIIRLFTGKMRSQHVGGVVCLDGVLSEVVTWVRSLVHAKRDKAQAKGNIQEALNSNMRHDTELKETLPTLLKSKEGFLPKLMLALVHEVQNPCPAERWNIADLLWDGQFFAIITRERSALFVNGGANTVDYDAGSAGSIELTTTDLRLMLDGPLDDDAGPVVYQQGQGEAMIFKVALRWLALLQRKADARVASEAGLDLICADTDASCGHLMPCIVSIVRALAGQDLSALRILLTVRGKDDRKMEELGLLLQQRLASRCLGPVTGSRLTAVLDAMALYDLAGVIGDDRLAVMVSSRGKTLEGLTSALQTGSRDAGFRDARDAVVVAMAVVVLAATSRAGADSDSDEDVEDGEDGDDAQAGRAAQRDGFGD
jgi:hypothetical protein